RRHHRVRARARRHGPERRRPRARGARAVAVPAMIAGNAALIESFLDMRSAKRGASITTIAAYRRDLLDFCARGDARRASRDNVKTYLGALAKAGIAASSQARKLSALRQFFGFLHAEGIRKDDPTSAVDAPRRVRPLPKVLSRDDVKELIDKAQNDARL